jgi:hypothetical protein
MATFSMHPFYRHGLPNSGSFEPGGYGCLLALPLPPRCFLFCATDGRWPKPLAIASASMYSCMFTPGYSWGITVQETTMN